MHALQWRHMDRPSRISGPLLPVRQKGQRYGRMLRSIPRTWRTAVLASVGFHLLLAGFLLFFVRPRHADPGENPVGTVELLMVEKRGSGEPSPPASPAPAAPAAPVPPKASVPDQAVAAPPVVSDQAGEPVPLPAPAAAETAKAAPPAPEVAPPTPQPAKAAETPAQPTPQQAPVFNLDGTDSESNAIAMGDQVLPASPDDRFRNRPPIYPYEAAARGEHGTVVVVIHVSEYGASTGADVAVSSGVVSLDEAALDAVRKWHFRPAMKDGQAIPFDMPMRFIFEAE
jgi:periplasmic protein TonB